MGRRTNHPITLTFEPVRVGDPSKMTGLSQNAGVYILGVMEPKRPDVFCPLYVGKITERLDKNLIRHYNGKRRGFFNGNTIVDVFSDFQNVYADIATMYAPTKPNKTNSLPRFQAIRKAHNTFLWYNSPEFYNTILNAHVYSGNNPLKSNDEKPHEMDGRMGHWAKMKIIAQSNKNLLQEIVDLERRYYASYCYMKKNFAFTYAAIDGASLSKAYPNASKKAQLEQEETATKATLLYRGIVPFSKSNFTFHKSISVDLTKVGRLYP